MQRFGHSGLTAQLRFELVDNITTRDRFRIHHHSILESFHLPSCLGYDLLDHDYIHQFVWRQGLWRGGIHLFYN